MAEAGGSRSKRSIQKAVENYHYEGVLKMDLAKYDGKHVRVTDKWGETFTGMAEYGNYSFLECESVNTAVRKTAFSLKIA